MIEIKKNEIVRSGATFHINNDKELINPKTKELLLKGIDDLFSENNVKITGKIVIEDKLREEYEGVRLMGKRILIDIETDWVEK